jgi:hypothetical protein
LVASRIVTTYEHGNERRYYLDRAMWGQFLRFQPNGWPTYRDWPRLLGALRQVSRWLHQPALDELTPYMLASNARALMEEIEPDLSVAGAPPSVMQGLHGQDYWPSFAERVEQVITILEQGFAA